MRDPDDESTTRRQTEVVVGYFRKFGKKTEPMGQKTKGVEEERTV